MAVTLKSPISIPVPASDPDPDSSLDWNVSRLSFKTGTNANHFELLKGKQKRNGCWNWRWSRSWNRKAINLKADRISKRSWNWSWNWGTDGELLPRLMSATKQSHGHVTLRSNQRRPSLRISIHRGGTNQRPRNQTTSLQSHPVLFRQKIELFHEKKTIAIPIVMRTVSNKKKRISGLT